MSVYADTSFIVPLYKLEANSGKAAKVMKSLSPPVWISPLVELEMRNSLRLAVFRKEMTEELSQTRWQQFKLDLADGLFVSKPIPASDWFASASALADRYSSSLGTRSLDLMHLAAAKAFGADHFLTFDERQQKAAKAERLKTALR